MSDPVDHPAHYTSSPAKCECGRTIECITITEHMGFCLGNAIKYIWRADLKGGVEDLEKAVWYLRREIGRRRVEAKAEPEQKEYGPWHVLGLPDGLFCVWRTASTGDGIAYTLPSGKRAVYSMPASAQEVADRLNRAGGGAYV